MTFAGAGGPPPVGVENFPHLIAPGFETIHSWWSSGAGIRRALRKNVSVRRRAGASPAPSPSLRPRIPAGPRSKL
jgi:hypothetical protein